MTYAASSFGLDVSKGQPTEATRTHTWWQCDFTSPSVFVPRTAALEKEVAGFREKIHHLDDMLKSQQRKVRQMIEQVRGGGSHFTCPVFTPSLCFNHLFPWAAEFKTVCVCPVSSMVLNSCPSLTSYLHLAFPLGKERDCSHLHSNSFLAMSKGVITNQLSASCRSPASLFCLSFS